MNTLFGKLTISVMALRKQVAVALVIGFAIVAYPAAPVFAQDSNLAREIERLRREIADLQRFVYKGQVPPNSEAAAADNEVAARLQLQIGQMQDQLREMNGRIEELQHRIDVVEQRLDRMSQDMEIRLREIEDRLAAGAGAPAAAEPDSPPPDAGGAGVALAGLPKDATPRQQYDYAFELLKTRDYDAAATALQTFLDRNPNDPLAGNALYWLGETRYVQKDYKEAARVFLDGYKRFPDGAKAPDNLLKLGMALAALNETESACKTYAKLLTSFPKAPSRVLRAAESEQKKLKCS